MQLPVARDPYAPSTPGKSPSRAPRHVGVRLAVPSSIFGWQEDRIIREPEGDAFAREVGERDIFDVDHVVIAVLAGQCGSHIGVYTQFPHLEPLDADVFVVVLDQRNFVKQPVGTCMVGDVLCAVCEEHFSVESVAVPVFSAGELREFNQIKFRVS